MKTKKKSTIQKHSTKRKDKKRTLKSSATSKHYDVNKIVNKIELDILLTTITSQILLLIHNKTPKYKIKKQTIPLLKEIRKNNTLITNTITDSELNLIFERIYKYTIVLNKELQKSKKNKTTQTKLSQTKLSQTKLSQTKLSQTNTSKGGFYLKTLEEKGDQPITGNDFTAFLDEIDQFIYNAQWTDEGAFMRDPYTLMNILRGNVDSFKSYLTWHVFPKYYQLYPPFIKWDGIKDILTRKWEDFPDYLLAYQSYNRSRDEYLVSKGLKSPLALNKGKDLFSKFANFADQKIQQFQQIRRKFQGIKTGNFTLQVPL